MRGGLARLCWAGVGAISAVLVPFAATAQSTPPVQPGDRLQTVDLIAEILYDSNVASSTAALAAARGIKPSDVIFKPALRFDLARPFGRETAYLQGSAGYDIYARNSFLNREDLDLHAGVLGRVGVCQPTISGEYSRAQRDLSELARSPAGLPFLFQEKNLLQVEEIGGDATCGRATGFAPSVSASETWTQNSSVIEHFIDAQTFSGSLGVAYRRPILGAVRLFAAFSHTDYPNRSGLVGTPGAAIATGYQTMSGGVTYTRAVGSRLQGQVSISYSKLDDQGSKSGGFSGLTYSAGLTYQVSSRLQASGMVSRATVPSNRLNSTFGINEIFSGQLSYRMGSRLIFSGGGTFNHEAYDGIPYPVGFDLTDEKVYSVFGNAKLKVTRRLSLDINVQQLQRNANYPGLSYPDTRAGLTAQATF